MKIIYIAGPYRADCALKTQRNISRAEELAKRVTLSVPGYYPLIPHTNTALWDFDRTLTNVEPEYYLQGNLELMRRCDAVLVVPDYSNSVGTIAEITEAEKLGIPVYYNIEQLSENG